MEYLYKFYSVTVSDPMPFEKFCLLVKNKPKFKQAYKIGILEPEKQLALIDYLHSPKTAYEYGVNNGIKLAMMIIAGTPTAEVDLSKPVEQFNPFDELRSMEGHSQLKGLVTKLENRVKETLEGE